MLQYQFFERWRRTVSLIVLITFFSSLITPVFAYQKVGDKRSANKINRSKLVSTLAPSTKPENNIYQSSGRFNNIELQNQYQPYFEIGGAKYFNQVAKVAGIYDLFIPLWQRYDQILFTDLRIFDRTGGSSEGNLHLGYRKLLPNLNQLFGIYVAFDAKGSNHRNSFKQFTLGLEYWNDRWFIGSNIYQPIGKNKKYIGETISSVSTVVDKSIIAETKTIDKDYEKALSGVDAEIGYAVTDNLTAYIGGYYFAAHNTNAIVGPKLRFTYDYQKPMGRILGVLDGISIEVGTQHDKPRGNTAYFGLKFKVGMTSFAKNSNLLGFDRHMIELVRRDPDIVIGKATESTSKSTGFYQEGSKGFWAENDSQKNQEILSKTLEELLQEFGLRADATLQDLKAKWKEYALKYHPDKNPQGQKQFIYYRDLYEKIIKEFRNRPQDYRNNQHQTKSENDCRQTNQTADYQTIFNQDSPKNENPIEEAMKLFVFESKRPAENKTYTTEILKDELNIIASNPAYKLNESQLKVLEQIAKSVETNHDANDLPFLKSVTQVLINHHNLSPAVFEIFSKEPDYFSDQIVTLLAEDKHLPSDLLYRFIDSDQALIDIKNPKAALFIALRLAQNHVILPVKILNYFLKFLLDQNSAMDSIHILAINLFHQLKRKIPPEITPELIDALITLFPKVNIEQQAKINDILDEVGLDSEQETRFELQKQISDWRITTNHQAKVNISARLFAKFHDKTVKNRYYFFKEHLHSQDSELLKIAKNVFAELKKYQEPVLDEDPKLLALLNISDTWLLRSWRINEVMIGGVSYLLTPEQKQNFSEQFNDLAEYLKSIKFTDFRAVNRFLEFVRTNSVSTADLNQIMRFNDSGSNIDIEQLYAKLLKSLLTKLQLSPHDLKRLKRSVGGLLDNTEWPADFLFTFIKKYIQDATNNLSVIIDLLEELNDYRDKITPDTIDRDGLTALIILKEKPLTEIPDALDRLRRDNSYFVASDVDSLLEQLMQDNPNDPAIAKLVLTFADILAEEKNISEDWIQSRYKLVSSKSKPVQYEEGNLYLYQAKNSFCLATTVKEACLNDLKSDELKKIAAISDNESTDTTIIYEQAIRLNLVPKLRGIAKPLSQWTGHNKESEKNKDNDFLKWRQAITNVTDNIPEVLAVLSQIVFTTLVALKKNPFYPRPAQLLALLSLLNSPNGRLAQIITGEGKSIIIFMLAAIKAMAGGQIDIVSSSNELARRDLEELKPFYDQLGIGADHNTDDADRSGSKGCYQKDVVYGDTTNFIADTLRDSWHYVRNERRYQHLIVDEVDNLFLDNSNMLVLLATAIPGFEVFNQLFTYMHGTAMEIAPAVEDVIVKNDPKQTGCYLKKQLDQHSEEANLLQGFSVATMENHTTFSDLRLAPTCDVFIEDYMKDYINMTLDLDQIRIGRLVLVPRHLETFVKSQSANWQKSLFSSFRYEERVHYIINKPDSGYDTIEVIDGDNSGTIMYGLQWEDGLHQFLQIMNGLTVIPEYLVSIFRSYFGFFSRYESINGVTGTIGVETHQRFLASNYGVKSIFIPPFTYKDLVKYPTIFARAKKEWSQEIIAAIQKNSKRGRATLVILDTIKDANEFYQKLVGTQSKEKIILYCMGGKKESGNIKTKLKLGHVVIATNLAGRGTDLEIDPEVAKNGGLHVIKGSFSASLRVELQAIGRAARKGEPGSAQLILDLSQLQTHCQEKQHCLNQECNNQELQELEECINAERDSNEARTLLADELIRVRTMKIRDNLYNRFVGLLRDADSPTGYKLVIAKAKNNDELEDLTLNLYEESSRLKLKIIDQEKGSLVIDVTPTIEKIDPRAESNIKTILSKPDSSVSALSQRDYELMHFIAASNGYEKVLGIYQRVGYAFNDLLVKEKVKANKCGDGKNGYLRWLLKNDGKFADLQSEKFGGLSCGDEKIDAALLDKVALRKMFFLWEEDRKIYNHESKTKQLTEDWGIWLKQNAKFPSYEDYNLTTVEGQTKAKEDFNKIEKSLNEKFSVFAQKERAKEKDGNLIQNPAYYVVEAWNNLRLHRDQLYSGSHTATENIPRVTGLVNYLKTAWKSIKPPQNRFTTDKKNYSPQDLLTDAIGFCDRALALDPEFIGIWAAYNARAIISLLQKSSGITNVEQRQAAIQAIEIFVKDTQKAIDYIETQIIPRFEAQLTFAIQHGLAYTNDYAIELMGGITIYQNIAKELNENIKVAIAAGNNKKGKLDVERPVSLNEITAETNMNNVVYSYLNKTSKGILNRQSTLYNITDIATSIQSGLKVAFNSRGLLINQISDYGGYLFRMKVVELPEKKKNWWGTFFSAVLGTVTIIAGVVLAQFGGIFLTTFASSLLSQGIGDIISAGMSVITANPINFNEYISAKGISLAVSAAISGVVQLLSKIQSLNLMQNLKEKADVIKGKADNYKKWIFDTFKMQTVSTGISKLTSSLGNKMMINKKDIEEEAKKAIDAIVQLYKELLQRIFAAGDKLANALYTEVENIIYNYRWQFNTVAKAGMDTGTGVLDETTSWGRAARYANSATQAIASNIESKKVIGKISRDVQAAIQSKEPYALKTGNLFEQKLITNYPEDGIKLAKILKAKEISINDHYNCTKFNDVVLDDMLTKYQTSNGIVKICEEIKALLANSNFEILRERFVSLVASLKTAVQKNTIQTGADVVASELSGPAIATIDAATDKLINYIKEKRAKANNGDIKLIPHAKPDSKIIFKGESIRKGEKSKDQSSSVEDEAVPKAKTCRVKKGDSLAKIAKENGITIEELKAANPQLKNRNFLREGQKINIPSHTATSDSLFTLPTDLDNAPKSLSELVSDSLNNHENFPGSVCSGVDESGWFEQAWTKNLNSYLEANQWSEGNFGKRAWQDFITNKADGRRIREALEASYLVYPEEFKKYGKGDGILEKQYGRTIDKSNYLNGLKARGYRFIDIEDKSGWFGNGFHGLALQEKSGVIMVSLEGTDFNDPHDRKNVEDIIKGKIPKQYKSAEIFADRVIKDHPNTQIIFTGQSSGALLAQMLAARFGKEAIVFESPGAKGYIDGMVSKKLVSHEYNPEKIKIINALPNFINTYGEHVNTPVAIINNEDGKICFGIGCNFPGTFSKENVPATYLHSHRIKHLLDGIDQDGSFKHLPIQNWPRSSLSFYKSQEAYKAMPEMYDQHIRQIWSNQYEHNFFDEYIFSEAPTSFKEKMASHLDSSKFDFRTRYPTFESYKKDYLKYGLKKDKHN